MYEAHIWYRVSRNPCHTRQAHQTWLRPRQKIKICCSIVCSRNLQCACNNNKNGAEQQDLGQISATHRHEDAKCVPVELLMCKVVITKWGLPACCMECTYSACVTLFASICSTDIVKLLIRCNFVHATRRKILSRATRLGRDIGDTSSWRCEMCDSRAADVQSGYHKMRFACMPYGMYLLCLCHPLCFNLQHGYCQAKWLL